MADWYSSDWDDAASLNDDTAESTHWEYTSSSGAEPARPINLPAPRYRAIPSFASFTNLSPAPPHFGDSSTVPTRTTTGMTGMTSASSSQRGNQVPNSTVRDKGAGSGPESPLTRLLSSSARQIRGRNITVHALTAQGSTLGIVFSSEPPSPSQCQSESESESESQSTPANAWGALILQCELTVSTADSGHANDPESWLSRYSGALTQPGLRGALTEVIRASIDIPSLPVDQAGVKGCFHKQATRDTELLTRQGDKSTVRVSALRNSEQGDRVRIIVDFDPNVMAIRGIETLW